MYVRVCALVSVCACLRVYVCVCDRVHVFVSLCVCVACVCLSVCTVVRACMREKIVFARVCM